MRPLALAPLTIMDANPIEMVMSAAAAGYQSTGIRIYGGEEPMTVDTPRFKETAGRLADTGLEVLDIWTLGLRPETTVAEYLPMFEAGARLGAQFVNTIGWDPNEERTTEIYAALCEAAEPYNLRISLEFAKFLEIKTLEQTLRIVQQTTSSSAGILIDALHLHRSGGTVEDVRRIDPKLLIFFQLCDARPQAPPDEGLLEEAVHDRLYPGEGVLPLRELLASLPADIPISVETPYKADAQLSFAERAKHSADATRVWLTAGGEA
jgi:sugar phosphate isomerase/epimerase